MTDEIGKIHPSIGYVQGARMPDGSLPEGWSSEDLVPLKPSADHSWQNGEWVYVAPPEPTSQELRAQMPPISKRQLRLTLVRNGIGLSDLDAAILAMGDEAIIEWQDASEYRRLHPLLNQVAAHLSLSQEQVDGMWQQALSA